MGAPRIDRLDRNLIINGNFDIWQRGTSLISVLNGRLADRFLYAADSLQADISRVADVPSNLNFNSTYSFRVARVLSQSPGVNDVSYVRYTLEGYDLAMVKNKTCTFSFWVKSTKTGIYCFTLKNDGNDRTFIKEYTINTANTWEKKVIKITLDQNTGTWGFFNNIGMHIYWMLQAGTNRRAGTTDSWYSSGGTTWSSPNQVNAFDAGNSSFQIAQVQMVDGDVPNVEFGTSGKFFSDELNLCRRYYEKSYDLSTNPGTATSVGSSGIRQVTASPLYHVYFSIEKRATPAIVPYDWVGTANRYRVNGADGSTVGTVSAFGVGTKGFIASASGAFSELLFQWTADAEL